MKTPPLAEVQSVVMADGCARILRPRTSRTLARGLSRYRDEGRGDATGRGLKCMEHFCWPRERKGRGSNNKPESTLRPNVEEPSGRIHTPRDRQTEGWTRAGSRQTLSRLCPVGPACPSASCLPGRGRPRPQTQLRKSSRKGSSFFWMSEDMGILGPQCAEHKHVLVCENLISNFHKIVLLL